MHVEFKFSQHSTNTYENAVALALQGLQAAAVQQKVLLTLAFQGLAPKIRLLQVLQV